MTQPALAPSAANTTLFTRLPMVRPLVPGRVPVPSRSRPSLTATLAARELAGARTVAVLDHHTGLGLWGHTEIICRHGADSSALQMARRWWGPDVTATALGESSSQAIDGNVRMAFVRWCPRAEVISAALEVGTLAPEAVLLALLEDHQAHRRPISARRQIRAHQAMRAAFVPAQAHWQQACVQRALELYAATLRGLTST